MELLPQWVISLLVVLIGLVFGSFVTALSWRLPRGISIFRHSKDKVESSDSSMRSFCPHCKNILSIIDLIPVLSWLLTRGKCRHCNATISIRYPLVEIFTASLALLFYWFLSKSYIDSILIDVFISMALAVILASIVVIDFEHKIIPDVLNISLGLLGIFLITSNMSVSHADLFDVIKTTLFNICIYAGFAVAIRWIFMVLMKKDPLGMGDIKFFIAIGYWLNLNQLPLFLFLSGLGGILVGLVWKKITGEEAFPFGPALVFAFIVSICLPENIFQSFL